MSRKRQKGKGMKRRKSWHRGPRTGRLAREAIQRIERAVGDIMTTTNQEEGDMADPVRKVTRELRPLAKHLAMNGAVFEFRSGHVYAMRNGVRVTMFSTGKSTDHRAKKNMVSQLKREWPELLDGFEGFDIRELPGYSRPADMPLNGDKEESVTTTNDRNKGKGRHGTAERKDWADATRIRLRACIDEHFEGKNSEFVKWAEEVAKEQKLTVWDRHNTGQSTIGKFLGGTTPVAANLVLIDAAIDAAYGTPKREPKVETTKQIVPPSERIVVTDVDRELLDGNDRIDELEAEVARKDTRIEELEAEVARKDAEIAEKYAMILELKQHPMQVQTGPKDRYLELLFKLSEDGNEMAMDRIEKLFLS